MNKTALKTELEILLSITANKKANEQDEFEYYMSFYNPDALVTVTFKNGLKEEIKYSEVLKKDYALLVTEFSVDELIKAIDKAKSNEKK
jgi:hypothetical protein